MTMAGTLIIMLLMNWQLALFIGALLILKSIQTVHTNRKMKNAFRRNRAKMGEVSARVEESLSGIRLTKAFAREPYELARFSEKSDELRQTRCASYRLVAAFSAGINFFTNFIHVAVLLAGGLMIAAGTLAFSDFVAFLLYVNIFMKPVFRLTILAEVYQRGMAGLHRFEEIMAVRPSVADSPEPETVGTPCGDIVFDHVSFGYTPAQTVLHELNFTIEAGKTTAFVGETGAGKSTSSVCSSASMIPRPAAFCWAERIFDRCRSGISVRPWGSCSRMCSCFRIPWRTISATAGTVRPGRRSRRRPAWRPPTASSARCLTAMIRKWASGA